jgi:hypothetical protein
VKALSPNASTTKIIITSLASSYALVPLGYYNKIIINLVAYKH